MKEERESINVGTKLISHAERQNMNRYKELVSGSPEALHSVTSAVLEKGCSKRPALIMCLAYLQHRTCLWLHILPLMVQSAVVNTSGPSTQSPKLD